MGLYGKPRCLSEFVNKILLLNFLPRPSSAVAMFWNILLQFPFIPMGFATFCHLELEEFIYLWHESNHQWDVLTCRALRACSWAAQAAPCSLGRRAGHGYGGHPPTSRTDWASQRGSSSSFLCNSKEGKNVTHHHDNKAFNYVCIQRKHFPQ